MIDSLLSTASSHIPYVMLSFKLAFALLNFSRNSSILDSPLEESALTVRC